MNLTTVERYLKKKKEAAPDDSATVPPMQAQNSSQTFSPTFPLSLFSISREFERKEEGDGIRTFLILNGGEGGGPTFLSLDPCSIQPHWKREEKKKEERKKIHCWGMRCCWSFPAATNLDFFKQRGTLLAEKAAPFTIGLRLKFRRGREKKKTSLVERHAESCCAVGKFQLVFKCSYASQWAGWWVPWTARSSREALNFKARAYFSAAKF